MPSLPVLQNEFLGIDAQERIAWLFSELKKYLSWIQKFYSGANVIVYASAWYEKPEAPANTIMIMPEDIHGFMTAVYGLDCKKDLVLIIHSPGGSGFATDTIISYLRDKGFPKLTAIIPVTAKSAGTMMALGCDEIVMGRQSELGPIDPQMPIGSSYVSSVAILEEFETIRERIKINPLEREVYEPIISQIGPGALREAENALNFSESLIKDWLKRFMFCKAENSAESAQKAVDAFSRGDEGKKQHARRIDRSECRALGLSIMDLEKNNDLQDSVLSVYHLISILFGSTQYTKIVANHEMAGWTKSMT